MADINSITNAASYRGDTSLGGFLPTAIEIDTKPVSTLAAYTVMQNKNLYDERVRNADNKIAELSEIAAYDIANARGKDRELAIQAMADLQNYAKEYARKGVPRNPQEKILQEVDLQTKIKDATDKIKSINKRGLSYQVRLNAINQENTTAEIKAVKKKQLDEEFDNTSWDTPISAEEKFNVVLPKIGAPAYTKNTTSVDTGNEIVQQEVQIFNPATNMNNATAEVLGFSEQALPANATPEQRRQFEITQASGGQVKVLNDAATFLNEALKNPAYRNEDGTLNTDAVAADNRIAAGILKGIDRYNKYATDLNQDINNGFYTTKTGGKVNLLNIMRPDDVFLIDKNQPLSAEKLVFIQKFLDAAPDQKDEKIIITGEQSEREGLALDWYNAKTSRINATKPASSNSSGRGGNDSAGSNQAALVFGEHVNRIKNFQERNGGKDLIVGYANIDPVTRKALGLAEGQRVRYLSNGTAMVGIDENGNGGNPMTIEQQKLNFIVAVKGGSKDEAQLDAKFVEEQENGFKNTLGTTSAIQIWDGWGSSVNQGASTQSSRSEQKTSTAKPTINDLRNKYNY